MLILIVGILYTILNIITMVYFENFSTMISIVYEFDTLAYSFVKFYPQTRNLKGLISYVNDMNNAWMLLFIVMN
jgi:hypothetical protein